MNKHCALIPITALVLLTTAGCATLSNGSDANNNRVANATLNTSDVNVVSNSTGVKNKTTSNADNTTTDIRLDVVKVFDKALHVSPDNFRTNPYSDVPSADWGYVHAAVEKGYFTADTSTHFGSDDGMDLKDVDHAYQLYVGIPDNHMAWNAGGSTVGFANAIGLNTDLSNVISQNNISALSINLSSLYQGYYKDKNGVYHVVFQPSDEYSFFVPNGKPMLPQTTIASELANDIQLADDTTLTIQGNTATVHVDGLSSHSKQEIAAGFDGKTEYSINGGPWHQTPNLIGSDYDSHSPSAGGDATSGAAADAPHSVVLKGSNQFGFTTYSWIENQDIGFTHGELSFSNSKITSVQYD